MHLAAQPKFVHVHACAWLLVHTPTTAAGYICSYSDMCTVCRSAVEPSCGGCTCLQAAREVDDARNAAAKAEAEAVGLRAALDAARSRHFEQLTK